MGGQTALKLAEKLDRYGIRYWNQLRSSIWQKTAEVFYFIEGEQHSLPRVWRGKNADQALALADELDFPILVRPSYVLGGQGMKIVINKEDLEQHVVDLLRKIPNNKLLLDHYLDGAIEAEADAICDGENVYIIGIMEHIEPCGIHSGDSNATLPVSTWASMFYSKLKTYPQDC